MKKTLITLCIIFCSVLTYALDTEGIDLNIRFYEQKIYFLGDQIKIKTAIKNNSSAPFRFKMADNRFFNLDFEVKTSLNQQFNHANQYIQKTSTNQVVHYRELSLEPGEEYAFVAILTDYTNITKAGEFTVQALFFPELLAAAKTGSLRSNILTLYLNPQVTEPEIRAKLEEETGRILAREALPPDQVVTYTIKARQLGEWEKFFLYIDLEGLLFKDEAEERKYMAMTEDGKKARLKEFKTELMQEKLHEDILTIPDTFQILETYYTPLQGWVKVTEKFKQTDFTRVKEYTYYLKKIDKYWIIYDYSIVPKEFEANQ